MNEENSNVKSHETGRFYLLVTVILAAISVFIAAALFQFKNQVYEREYNLQMETLESLSVQGSAVLEERLNGYLDTLAGMAALFQEGELWDQERMKSLVDLMEEQNTDFPRMGVADTTGKAMMTNGSIVDISEAEYYRAALNKESVISESHTSKLINEQVFMAAVPIYNKEKEVRGVLFAIVEVEEFGVFENTSLDDVDHYIKVIDRNGDYLVNALEFSMEIQADNIFALLSQADCSISPERVRESVENGEKLLVQINDGKKDYIVYFTPLENYQWYVVTIMEKKAILERVEYLLNKDLYWMMAKVGLAVVLVCAGVAWFLWRDKKRTEAAYRQLQINSKMIQTAFSCTNTIILIYNSEKDILGIINRDNILFHLPEVVENASENLIKLLPDHPETRPQVQNIFKRMSSMKDDEDFELSLNIDGGIRRYIIHVKAVEGADKKIVRNVGVVEDITERLNLREQAETDYLTGIDNRRSATEKINSTLMEMPETGRLHAFVILDLDCFKLLNDTLGHGMGDQALKDVAMILRHHFRESDVISRLAGDEFVAFVRDIPRDVLEKNMKVLFEKLNLTYTDNGCSINITASAGVAEAPRDGQDFDTLYHKADKALYQAKEKGKNVYSFYRAE